MSPLATTATFLLFAVPLAAQILPPPPQPAGNPSTPDKIQLGKALFWDEQLSASRTVACGTCHIFSSGGSDPRTNARNPGADGVYGTADDIHGSPGVSRQDSLGRYLGATGFGIDPQVTTRRAPSPINAAYQPNLFWDGRAGGAFNDPVTGQNVLASGAALESQASGPPVSEVEMGHVGRSWTAIAYDLPSLRPLALATNVPPTLAAFVQGQTYAQLFQQVYGSPGVTPTRILMAIAAYQRTLVSDQSPYDLFLVGQYTLSATEAQGLQVFNALCTSCHQDVSPTVLSTGPVLMTFHNIGVRPNSEDQGRFAVTQNPTDLGAFRIPGMRNVALRAPYLHNGSAATLLDVVEFYRRGGDFHQNQDPAILNIIGAMSGVDRGRVVAFLQSMTDPRVANELPPFDRPRLWSEGPLLPQTIGTGTAGSGGLRPRAVALEPAYLGNAKFTVGLADCAPGAFPFMVWDLAANVTPTTLFGHAVYLAQSPAMTVGSGGGLTLGSGPGGGLGSITFALPSHPSFTGVSLFGQWLVVDAQGPVGFSSSNAFGFTMF